MNHISLQTVKHTLLSLLLAAAFFMPHTAAAFFSNDAEAAAGTFGAGTLEVTLDTDTLATTITGTSGGTASFTTADVGSLIPQFALTATSGSCASEFYDALDVVVTQGSVVYDGPLSGLAATSTSTGEWELAVTASSTLVAAEDDTCEVALTVAAWQAEFPIAGVGGFMDEHVVTLTVTAGEDIGAQQTGSLVLNEIYPATLSTTTEPLEREWVELYNGTDDAIDVAGWSIGEDSGGSQALHTIDVACPASGVSEAARPYGTSNTVIQPGARLVIEFCGSASYLNDGGDTVTLFERFATTSPIDTYTYGATANGKSHARIPDGSTWVDPVPTPGMPNTATAVELRAEGWSDTEIEAVLPNSTSLRDVVNNDGSSTANSGSTPERNDAAPSDSTNSDPATSDERNDAAPSDSTNSDPATSEELLSEPKETAKVQKSKQHGSSTDADIVTNEKTDEAGNEVKDVVENASEESASTAESTEQLPASARVVDTTVQQEPTDQSKQENEGVAESNELTEVSEADPTAADQVHKDDNA